MRNIFVLGLDDLNHAVLQDMPGAHDCQFHQLLTREELQRGTVSVPDLLANAEQQLAAFDGSIDAIVGYWDFPSTLMVPLLCEPRGPRSASLEAVVKCEHKYWSRLVQQDVIDEHPAFGLIDLNDTDVSLPAHMSYPVWIKPIESHSSKGAHYIDDEQHLHEAIPSVRETVEQLSGPFRNLADIRKGDILTALPDLIKEAPAGAHVVVFHSSVLVYMSAEGRHEFADQMRAFEDVTWISNEGRGVFPFIADQVAQPVNGRTILSVNGKPVALVGPHGQSYESLD